MFNPDTNGTVVIYRTTNTSFPPFMELDHDGNIVRKWGQGEVTYAHDLTLEEPPSTGFAYDRGSRSLWFTDTHAATVKRLDPSGNAVAQTIGQPFVQGHGISPLQLSNVSHIAFSSQGDSAFITDGDSLGSGNPDSNHRLVKLDLTTGKLIWVIGNNGTVRGNDDFEFCDPHFSSYDAKRDWIWVADRGRVFFFGRYLGA